MNQLLLLGLSTRKKFTPNRGMRFVLVDLFERLTGSVNYFV